MILILFNIFLFTIEVLSLLIKCLYIFGHQLVKYICPQNRKEVSGQIVVITGAGSGIGRALAIRFAKLNAITVLWDIDRVLNPYIKDIITEIVPKFLRIWWKSRRNRSDVWAEPLTRWSSMLATRRESSQWPDKCGNRSATYIC